MSETIPTNDAEVEEVITTEIEKTAENFKVKGEDVAEVLISDEERKKNEALDKETTSKIRKEIQTLIETPAAEKISSIESKEGKNEEAKTQVKQKEVSKDVDKKERITFKQAWKESVRETKDKITLGFGLGFTLFRWVGKLYGKARELITGKPANQKK